MIQLHSDKITFAFPALDKEIEQLLDVHAIKTAVEFVGTFREKARSKLTMAEGHSWSNKTALQAAREKLRALSDEAVADAYHSACMKAHREGSARCGVSFQRTLRLPDDGKVYPLPAGLGRFPLRSISHYAESAPASWNEKGGVVLPMYQGEAMWLSFDARMPFALKIVSGSVNALTGELDQDGLTADPQNYLPIPNQPWLDGFQVQKGIVRQFVAMPLGGGYAVSEQLARDADAGGLAIEAVPMRAERYFQKLLENQLYDLQETVMNELLRDWEGTPEILYCCSPAANSICEDMGLGAGGKIQQEIYKDKYGVSAWDCDDSKRLCVHVCNSMMWRSVTGENPPHPPVTAKEYNRHDIPWFDYYRDDLVAIPEAQKLAGIKSVDATSLEKGLPAFESDDDLDDMLVTQHGNARRPDEIREWAKGIPTAR